MIQSLILTLLTCVSIIQTVKVFIVCHRVTQNVCKRSIADSQTHCHDWLQYCRRRTHEGHYLGTLVWPSYKDRARWLNEPVMASDQNHSKPLFPVLYISVKVILADEQTQLLCSSLRRSCSWNFNCTGRGVHLFHYHLNRDWFPMQAEDSVYVVSGVQKQSTS